MRLLSCFSPLCRKCPHFSDAEDAPCPTGPAAPPIMESCASEALTNTGPVRILTVDAQPWRVASPQDQPLLTQLGPGSLTPLTWLGEGAYGCVELCRVSVSIPVTPHDSLSSCQHGLTAQEQCDSHTPPAYGRPVSQPIIDSCDDPLRTHAAADGTCPQISSTAAAAATASEALLSPREREEVVVRPGRFSVNRLHLPPSQPHDPPPPLLCTTPVAPSRLPGYFGSRLHRRSGNVSMRASAPAVTITVAAALCPTTGGGGSVTNPAGTSAAASAVWPATPPSAAGASAVPGTGGVRVNVSGSLYGLRPCSSESTAAHSSAPPSARSPGGGPQQPTTPSSTSGAAASASASAVPVLSNELVVAVKRVGFRGSTARTVGGGRGDADGGADGCTGGAVGRGRGGGGGGGGGPSRTRLNRMQAIELLQLSRCRECPFIVRVFGCVPDEPRRATTATMAASGAAASTVASPAKLSALPAKLSPRRPRFPSSSSSSSSSSCRIVMEWAEGGDLGSLLKALAARRGTCSDPSRERLLMSEASARFYVACLLEALSFLHGKGLMHRDVKPANLLLTSDGRAKLGDLGMVCHLDRDGAAAGRAGTPVYMAPEVWVYGTGPKHSSYGANADLWSAGVTLHEMLTGHLPESHPDEYLRRNWSFSPRHAALSPELRDLLARLLTPRPRRRLQSCAEVVAHPWFAGFDWKGLRDGSLQAPYVPAAHRPMGGGRGATAASAGARLLRQSPSLGPAAGAAGGPCGGAGLRNPGGGVGEPMPPLLEENATPAAAAAAAPSSPTSTAAAAAAAKAAASMEMTDGGAGGATSARSSDISAAARVWQSGPAASPGAGGRAGSPALTAAGPSGQPSLDCSASGSLSGAQPPRPAAATATAAPSPSAAGGAAASVWRSLGWGVANRSSGSASAPVSAGAAAATAAAAAAPASPGGGRGSSCGGLGLLGSALASAFAPIVSSSPRASRDPPSAAAATSGSGGCGCGATTASVPGSGSGGCVTATTTAANSRETSALFLSTTASAAAAAAASTATHFTSDYHPAVRGDSRTTATSVCSTGGAATCGSAGSSVLLRRSLGRGSLAASVDSQPAAAAAAAAAHHDHQAQPLSLPWTIAPLLAARRDAGRSGGGAAAHCGLFELPGGATPQDRGGLSGLTAMPLEEAAAAAAPTPPSPSALLRALASLQENVPGLGPAGRRAGGWVQQRLAEAAALAAALPDQLQSAAAAAAAAIVGGGGGGIRACRSEGGAVGAGTGAAGDVAVAARGPASAAVLLQWYPAFPTDRHSSMTAANREAGGGVCGAAAPSQRHSATAGGPPSDGEGSGRAAAAGQALGGSRPASWAPGRPQLGGESDGWDAAMVAVAGRGSVSGSEAGAAAREGGGLGGSLGGLEGCEGLACCSRTAGSSDGGGARRGCGTVAFAPASGPSGLPPHPTISITTRGARALTTTITNTTTTSPTSEAASLTKTDPLALPPRPPPPVARTPSRASSHQHTGSFCFDPLDQSRPAGYPQSSSGGSPAKPPCASTEASGAAAAPPPPSSGRDRALGFAHGRSTSFTFDINGLLSAGGLLLSGSPVLLAAATAAAAAASSPPARAASSPPAVTSTATTSGETEEWLPTTTRESAPAATGDDGGGSSSLTASASVAAAAVMCGLDVGPSSREADAGPEASCQSPTSRRPCNGFEGGEWSWVGPGMSHVAARGQPWQAAEAAVLLYAACVAVLVMAWALIRGEGGGGVLPQGL